MLLRVSTVTLIFLLFYITVAHPSTIVIKRKPTIKISGFRCNTRIFTQESLLAAIQDAKDAFSWVTGSLRQKRISPEIHSTTFGFGENGYSYLWPLMDPAESSWLNGEVSEVYYVVLGGTQTNLYPIGVVEKKNSNTYQRCIREPDLNDMWGHLVVTGFRCPTDIFSIEVAEKAAKSVKNFITKSKSIKQFPAELDSKQSLFDMSEPLYSWPIRSNGVFNSQALTSIVVDKDMNLVGMIHRRKDKSMRCRVTPVNQFLHKFVESNILEEPKIVDSENLEVFKCGLDFLRYDLALKGVAEAINGFKVILNSRSRLYPKRIADSDDDNHPESYYLWPATLDGSSVFKPDTVKFKPGFFLFYVITDFSDVIGVVRQLRGGRLEQCEKQIILKSAYDWYRENPPTALDRVVYDES